MTDLIQMHKAKEVKVYYPWSSALHIKDHFALTGGEDLADLWVYTNLLEGHRAKAGWSFLLISFIPCDFNKKSWNCRDGSMLKSVFGSQHSGIGSHMPGTPDSR